MPLAAGTTLGQYEIRSALGAGGMGEVYRAYDNRLQREVAIKVLPESLTSDPERLRRFEQEARVVAALNHPNILAVYQMATHNGVSYMVTEFLDGETLRERLTHAPLPLRKAIDYAVQIAHGLAAAHDRGIIHRDLKPENIFVTKDGRIKILDFGLAKLQENPHSAVRSPHSHAAPDAPTLAESTQPGMVVGTPAYMSPEQVRGEPTDHRTDIFAFGCVLYEMLSGRRAFRRDTPVESMNAVLKEDPPDLRASHTNIPPAPERVVRRCLEKSPESRFQSAKDLAFGIENAGTASTSDGVGAADLTPKGWRIPRALPWALATFLAAALAFLLIHKPAIPAAGEPGQARVLRRFDITLPSSAHSAGPREAFLSIAPDGKKFAYVDSKGLWLWRLDGQGPPVLLAGGGEVTGTC